MMGLFDFGKKRRNDESQAPKKQETQEQINPAKNAEELYNRGWDAYRQRDYSTAVVCFRESAELGHIKSQNDLGLMYDSGYGVEKNDTEAVKWYRFAAEQGYATAQCNLGYMYEAGRGIEKSYAEAVRWYRMSAEQGHARGQCNLGYMYEKGRGVEKNYVEAVRWYRAAAEQGQARGQCNLGYMYAKGYGVEKNDTEAVKWYRASAEQGFSRAQYNLAIKYKKGQGVEQNYTEAIKWYRAAAEQGHEKAAYYLAQLYDEGTGTAQNKTEAAKWYRVAAEKGHANAQFNLGLIYYNGEGVAQNYEEAAKWFRTVAENGDAQAAFNLAAMYYVGEGVAKDLSEAEKWATTALNAGHEDAKVLLEQIYTEKEGMIKAENKSDVEALGFASETAAKLYDLGMEQYLLYFKNGDENAYMKAVEYYMEAADYGSSDACHQLALMYQEGLVLEYDAEESMEWFDRADQLAQIEKDLKTMRRGLWYVDLCFEYDGVPMVVLDVQNHIDWLTIKARDLRDYTETEIKVVPEEQPKYLALKEYKGSYLYTDGELLYFMNKYGEQCVLPVALLGAHKLRFMKEDEEYTLKLYQGNFAHIIHPPFVTFEVTEIMPYLVNGEMIQAELETGATIWVPADIGPEDVVQVDPVHGTFLALEESAK